MTAKNKVFCGVISLTRRTVGYVPHEKYEEDIEIRPEYLGTALHGDEVDVEILPQKGRSRTQGKVIGIRSREHETFVGTLVSDGDGYLFKPRDQKFYPRLHIPQNAVNNAAQDNMVVVEITAWKNAQMNPLGKVVRILGRAGEHETEMLAALATHGFESAFPPDVEKEAKQLEKQRTITRSEIGNRRDVRNIPTFTIDPDDAKDFDDALSYRRLPNGLHEIGIHIADVTHYVKPETAIDKEARRRATSVYLVDRTIPMLPEVLSNDICSLKPNEDRLTFSAILELDDNAVVKNKWFGRAVIHSDKRFTYHDAQEVLDTKNGPHSNDLAIIYSLSLKLRKRREKQGALAFDTDEVKFELDENGKPLRAFVKERLETMRMIEDWMLLANRCVAEFIADKCKDKSATEQTFIYRIHDNPDPDKLEELRIFLKAIGHDLGHGKAENISSKDINRLLKEVKGTPEEAVVQMATLRSMAKAIYSHKNIGHFSLSFKHYTHFTSPIRRYPDMMVHRILESHLQTVKKIGKNELLSYQRAAVHASEREVEAVEAERDSVKFKQVEYMSEHIGDTFEGMVTGVTENGIFVAEKETRAEGMVRASTLKDDYYEYDRKRYALVGRKTKRTFRLGDGVKIKLISADMDSRQLDWEIAT